MFLGWANERDTKHLFCLHAAQTGKHLLQTQKVSDKNQKHFLCLGHKICVRNKCCAHGQTGKHVCPQQCVRNIVSSFATTLRVSFKDKSANIKFNIVEATGSPSMLGCRQCQDLGIISANLDEVNTIPLTKTEDLMSMSSISPGDPSQLPTPCHECVTREQHMALRIRLRTPHHSITPISYRPRLT